MNMNVASETVKKLRIERGWTQEHLASLTGLTARTIQRVEKTGVCDLETRSALASVFQVDLVQLDGEKKIEQAKAPGPDGVLYYRRLMTGSDIVGVFAEAHGYRFSNEDARTEADAESMASATAFIHDYSEIWSEIEPGARVTATFEIGSQLDELHAQGFVLFGLRTRAKMNSPGSEPYGMKVANFHIAYADSERIVVLDNKQV